MAVLFRVRYVLRGDHVHSRLFVGQAGGTLAASGSFVTTREEFCALRLSSEKYEPSTRAADYLGVLWDFVADEVLDAEAS